MLRQLALGLFAVCGSFGFSQTHYDLGGPCVEAIGPDSSAAIRGLLSQGQSDRAVETAKANVRAGCGIDLRWRKLAETLILTHHESDALKVLEEMEARGFDFNTMVEHGVSLRNGVVDAFMQTRLFEASPLGMRLARLRKESDDQRAKYRQLLASLPASQRPREAYVAEGACPFECCHYGDWTAMQDTSLVAEPGSDRIVGTAMKGTRVVALTGEVHLRPEPVVVVGGPLPRNSIVFILDYIGEGSGHIFVNGTVTVSEVQLAYGVYCIHPSETCWGETLWPPNEKRREPVWWARIRLPNGTVGWTDRPGDFAGVDGCG